MRTTRNLWPLIVETDNLYAAWREARRGKRYRGPGARFEVDADHHLHHLHVELSAGTYRPGRYRIIFIREPKRRAIAAAPFRDRVVHHALCRHLVPPLARSFIDDSYACRPGKGTHRAVLRQLEFMRRYRYRCHLDVRAFFASIDIDLLLAFVARRIRDDGTLDLLTRILEGGLAVYADPRVLSYLDLDRPPGDRRGIPVGNLTSQHLANVFLGGVDHHVKRACGVGGYTRFMDDMTLFGDERQQLLRAARSTAHYLSVERGLELKAEPRVVSTHAPVRYLGHRIDREGLSVAGSTLAKVRRGARALRGRDADRIARSLASWRALPWL